MRGIGVDLTAVDRLRDLLARHGDRFRDRCFGPLDLEPVRGSGPDAEAAHLASAWSAKEAFLKALGLGLDRVPPRQVQLVLRPGAAPALALGPVATLALAAAGASTVHVALASGGGCAAAFVALE